MAPDQRGGWRSFMNRHCPASPIGKSSHIYGLFVISSAARTPAEKSAASLLSVQESEGTEVGRRTFPPSGKNHLAMRGVFCQIRTSGRSLIQSSLPSALLYSGFLFRQHPFLRSGSRNSLPVRNLPACRCLPPVPSCFLRTALQMISRALRILLHRDRCRPRSPYPPTSLRKSFRPVSGPPLPHIQVSLRSSEDASQEKTALP